MLRVGDVRVTRYNSPMRFEVPQFIEIEDKIVGPLTWKQFVYVAGGVGVNLIILLNLPFVFFIFIGLPFGILAASLAFHRINNRPFSIFLESFLNYTTKKKLYLWRKQEQQTVVEKTITETVIPAAAANLDFARKKSINALSRKLEVQVPGAEK